MFTPNQKVVCINDQFPLGIEKIYQALPKKDVIYVVRDIVPGCSVKGEAGEIAVYLLGVENRPNRHGIEPGFNCERFAPLAKDRSYSEEEELSFAPSEPEKVLQPV